MNSQRETYLMELTLKIRKAIIKYMDDNNLSAVELSRKLFLAPNSVGRWISGKTKTIKPKNWKKVYPLVKQYIELEVDETTLPKREKEWVLFQNFFNILTPSDKIEIVKHMIKLTNDTELKSELIELLRQ